MEILVADGRLPKEAYLSIRVGEERRQRKLKFGDTFIFPVKHDSFTVDVFEKVASRRVRLSEIHSKVEQFILSADGRFTLDLGLRYLHGPAKVQAERRVADRKVSRHQSAIKASSYLERHSVAPFLEGMLKDLVSAQPDEPFVFLEEHIRKNKEARRRHTSAHVDACPGHDRKDAVDSCHTQSLITTVPTKGNGKGPPLPAPRKAPERPSRTLVGRAASVQPNGAFVGAATLEQARSRLRSCPARQILAEKTNPEQDEETNVRNAEERAWLVRSLETLAAMTTLGVVPPASVGVPSGHRRSLGRGRCSNVVPGVVLDALGNVVMHVASKRFADGNFSAVPLCALRSARRECEALLAVQHPNVVSMFGVVIPPLQTVDCPSPPLQLLLAHWQSSLHSFIVGNASWNSLSRVDRVVLLSDIASGLERIHVAGLAHLDIKSHNVLVRQHKEVGWAACVCDLGAVHYVGDAAPTPEGSTSGWVAPEVLTESPGTASPDFRSADIFSLGVVIWEVVQGNGAHNPLCGLTGDAYVDAVIAGTRPRWTHEVVQIACHEASLAAECWCCDAASRPLISSVQHSLTSLLRDLTGQSDPCTDRRMLLRALLQESNVDA